MSHKGAKAGSKCRCDVTPQPPLCSTESGSAPRSVTLGTGWAGVPLLAKKGVLWHPGERALFGRLYPGEQAYPLLSEGQCCLFAGISQNSCEWGSPDSAEGLHSCQRRERTELRVLTPATYRWKEKSSVKGRVRVLFIFTLEFIQPFVAFFPALYR